jgi:hypothetical protein
MNNVLKFKPRPKPVPNTRRFTTDYAGCWSGHCKTRESAIIAAIKHIVQDGYTRATITDKHTGQDVARVRLSEDRKRAVVEVVKPFKKVGL